MPNTLYRLIVVALLAGCANNSTYAEDCTSKNPVLRIDTGMIDYNEKKPICVTVPGSFTINIKKPCCATHTVGLGDVRVHEKSDEGPEIRGENDPKINKVVVEISGDGDYDQSDFGFFIVVDGVGKLDPRVRVIESQRLVRLKTDEINEHLVENFDIDIATLRKLPEQKDE